LSGKQGAFSKLAASQSQSARLTFAVIWEVDKKLARELILVKEKPSTFWRHIHIGIAASAHPATGLQGRAIAGFAPSCFATLAIHTLVISLHELHKGLGLALSV
jgi:hypothetical protein